MPSLSVLPNLTQGVSALSQLANTLNETDTQAKCIDITHCRTIWNIIWSCLATIFACAWVAVHRNVPDPTRSAIRVSLDRVAITICALLVPEYMVGWAVRQWLVARRITRDRNGRTTTVRDSGIAVDESCRGLLDELIQAQGFEEQAAQLMKEKATTAGGWTLKWYNFRNKHLPDDDSKWTVTHGFFALMGGFYHLDSGNNPHPLSPEEVLTYIDNASLELPKKSDINDKSKGDAFSKFVASLQTIWFVMQSIARPMQHLPLTKLEIATLAYTSINVAMYFFWWSKPLSVSRPIRVRGFNVSSSATSTAFEKPQPVKGKPATFLATLLKTVMGTQDDDAELSELAQVPNFYAGKPTEWENLKADAIALGFAMVFGAVHCVAWSFAFPSHAEKLIWRIASIALVGVPAIYIFLIVLWIIQWRTMVQILLLLSFIGIPFYLLARVVLLVLAFTTLRSLPATAFETVHWTTFIPHV